MLRIHFNNFFYLISEEVRITYCETESLSIDCGYSGAIIITSARYGRMQAGICSGVDDQLGCFDDVIGDIGMECTGKQQCEIANIAGVIERPIAQCDSRLRRYFVITHMCVHGTCTTCMKYMSAIR